MGYVLLLSFSQHLDKHLNIICQKHKLDMVFYYRTTVGSVGGETSEPVELYHEKCNSYIQN